jgi:hypothetical protein
MTGQVSQFVSAADDLRYPMLSIKLGIGKLEFLEFLAQIIIFY